MTMTAPTPVDLMLAVVKRSKELYNQELNTLISGIMVLHERFDKRRELCETHDPRKHSGPGSPNYQGPAFDEAMKLCEMISEASNTIIKTRERVYDQINDICTNIASVEECLAMRPEKSMRTSCNIHKLCQGGCLDTHRDAVKYKIVGRKDDVDSDTDTEDES
jgi:hypothetical protein